MRFWRARRRRRRSDSCEAHRTRFHRSGVQIRELPSGEARWIDAASCREAAEILAREERWPRDAWSVRLYAPRGRARTFEVCRVEWAPLRPEGRVETMTIGYIVVREPDA